jgi:hypothetical protein
LNDGSTTELDKSSLIWTAAKTGDDSKALAMAVPSTASAPAADEAVVPLTVYLNSDRSVSLFSVRLAASGGLKASMIAKRAVAIRAA